MHWFTWRRRAIIAYLILTVGVVTALGFEAHDRKAITEHRAENQRLVDRTTTTVCGQIAKLHGLGVSLLTVDEKDLRRSLQPLHLAPSDVDQIVADAEAASARNIAKYRYTAADRVKCLSATKLK